LAETNAGKRGKGTRGQQGCSEKKRGSRDENERTSRGGNRILCWEEKQGKKPPQGGEKEANVYMEGGNIRIGGGPLAV